MADTLLAPGAATRKEPSYSYIGEETLSLARDSHPLVFHAVEKHYDYQSGVVGFRGLDLFEERREGSRMVRPLRLTRCVETYPHGEKRLIIDAELVVERVLYSADLKTRVRITDSRYVYVGLEDERGEEVV